MQNSVNAFPWAVNPSNFSTSNSSNSKTQSQSWPDYQSLAADFFLKKNPNIYPSTISQLAAISNLTANDMQLSSQSQLPDLNDLSGLNEKCPHYPNDNHNKYSCELCFKQLSLNLNNKDLKNMQNNSNLNHFSQQLSSSNTNHLAMLSNTGIQSSSFSNSSKQTSNNNNSANGFDNSNFQSNYNNSSNFNSSNSTSSNSSERKNSSNKGQFLCTACNKTFTQKGNLKTHMLLHSQSKPFSCNVCAKQFTQKGNRDTHMKIHLPASDKKPTNKKQIKQKDFSKDRFRQSNNSNLINSNQDNLLNQNQSVMERLLPMHSSLINSFNRNDEQANNLTSSIKSNQSHQNSINNSNQLNGYNSMNFSNSSTSNWSNLTNNLANNLTNNLTNSKSNRNSSATSSSNNFQANNFENNFAQMAYNDYKLNVSQRKLDLLNQLNQNSKPSSMQQFDLGQINNYNIDFPLLQ